MDAATTASVFNGLNLLMNMVGLGLNYTLNPSLPGARRWFQGTCIIFVSNLFLALFHAFPAALPLATVGNLGVLSGMSLVAVGVFEFCGKPVPWRYLLGQLAATAVVHSWFLYAVDDVKIRVIVMSLVLAAINFRSALVLSTTRLSVVRIVQFCSAIGWWGICAVMLLRAVLTVLEIGIDANSLSATHNTVTYLLAFIIAPVGISVAFLGLMIMTVTRLIEERDAALAETRQSILERDVANRELERLSVTDRLTGLSNRRKLDEILAEEQSRSLRYSSHFSVVLLDVDRFKQVNDTHGHQVGDQVLAGMAGILTRHTREADEVGRWGGEEFLVICRDTDQPGAAVMAEKLRDETANHPFPVVGSRSASFGVAQFRAGESVEELLARADAAMYRAKQKGRNRVEVAD